MSTPAFIQAEAWGVKSKNGTLTMLNCTTRQRARSLCYRGAKPVRVLVTIVEVLPHAPAQS